MGAQPGVDAGKLLDAPSGAEPSVDAGKQPDAPSGAAPNVDVGKQPDAMSGAKPSVDAGKQLDAPSGADAEEEKVKSMFLAVGARVVGDGVLALDSNPDGKARELSESQREPASSARGQKHALESSEAESAGGAPKKRMAGGSAKDTPPEDPSAGTGGSPSAQGEPSAAKIGQKREHEDPSAEQTDAKQNRPEGWQMPEDGTEVNSKNRHTLCCLLYTSPSPRD